VSHEARAKGVRKGDGIGARGQKELEWFKGRPEALMPAVLDRCPGLVVLPMDTDFYRVKSREIREQLERAPWATTHKPVVEQASIDDYYLDITAEVDARMNSLALLSHRRHADFDNDGQSDDEDGDAAAFWAGLGGGNECSAQSAPLQEVGPHRDRASVTPLPPLPATFTSALPLYSLLLPTDTSVGTAVSLVGATTILDGQEAVIAAIMGEIRRDIRTNCGGMTLSCGAANSKLLARLVSKRGSNLHDVQTLLREGEIPELLRRIPIQSVPRLKGKLGAAVKVQTGAVALADLQRCPQTDLERFFGAISGSWLFAACRGIDHAAVTPTAAPKSLLVERSFPEVTNSNALSKAVSVLAGRLVRRGIEHAQRHREIPGGITVTCRQQYDETLSKRMLVPQVLAACFRSSVAAAPISEGATDVTDKNRVSTVCIGADDGAQPREIPAGVVDAVTKAALGIIRDHLTGERGLAVTRVALTLISFSSPPSSRPIEQFFLAPKQSPAPTDQTTSEGRNDKSPGAARSPAVHSTIATINTAPAGSESNTATKTGTGTWSCRACTYLHEQNRHGLLCEMCGTKRVGQGVSPMLSHGSSCSDAHLSTATKSPRPRKKQMRNHSQPSRTLTSFGFMKGTGS
jgi:nucleotidyltransferase/DNA polymerase involved in DNA repair